MLHEFAVEPAALVGWNPIWMALEQFGVHHGRLISRFPKKWTRMVHDLLNKHMTAPEVQVKKHELIERLNSLKSRLISTGRQYDPNESWVANAEREHKLRPFRGIICAENSAGASHLLTDSSLHDGNERWAVPRELPVARDPRALADSVSLLLEMADHLLFVDPHFRPEQRFTAPLEEFLAAAHRDGRKLSRIEYHVKQVDWWTTYCDDCRKWLPQRIPTGVEVKIVAWAERPGGEKLHPRYILTDIGGVRVEVGLDSGDPGQTTDVSLLDRRLYEERWKDFQPASAAFEYKAEIRITGTLVL